MDETRKQRSEVWRESHTEHSVYTRGGGKGTVADGAFMDETKQQRNEVWRVSHTEWSVYTRGGGKGTAADGAFK